jgi:hypothetical protein
MEHHMKITKAFLATIATAALLAADVAIAQAAVFARTTPPSQRGACGREIAWPWIRLDERLLALGRRA